MSSELASDNQTKVFYDDKCRLCIKASEYYGQGKAVDLKPLSKSELPKGVSRQQAENYIQAVGPDGKRYEGVWAVLHLLETQKRHQWLQKLLRISWLSGFWERAYLFISKRRHRIGRILFRAKTS